MIKEMKGPAEGSHGVGYAAAALDDFLVAALGFEVPLPAVFEGGDLGGRAGAVLFGEEDVVVLAGVEGWVEVDEVYGGVGDIVAEDLEVIAVVELVFLGRHSSRMVAGWVEMEERKRGTGTARAIVLSFRPAGCTPGAFYCAQGRAVSPSARLIFGIPEGMPFRWVGCIGGGQVLVSLWESNGTCRSRSFRLAEG